LVVGVRVGAETGFWSRGRLPDGVDVTVWVVP
jgi:hypothetical protein